MQRPPAIFAAGCFWGVEAAFRALPGVTRTTAGYTGGHQDRPTYEQVCSGATGHAEAVEVEYDPARISYGELLDTFWSEHDPTTPGRQGWDIGNQYRSAIFVADEDQAAEATASRDARQNELGKTIVTEITPARRFWAAEEYHQQFLEKPGRSTWAVTIDVPAA